jgi:linoleoyl-CoA desaturase
MKNLKFSPVEKSQFSDTLRERVNEYFTSNNISSYGNYNMVLKSVFMMTVYITPLILFYTQVVTNEVAIFFLYILIGLGKAGIGMGIMHDANHGSYSKNKTVNKWMGLTINFIGANAKVWKIQHNVLHHTYTNIDGADDDINVPGVLRFSPNAKRYWFHKFQFLYAWIFYGISTLWWMTVKDFVRLTRFKNMNLVKSKKEYWRAMLNIMVWKIFYFSYILVIPMIILPVSPWVIVLSFVSMHFVTGLILSIIFQTAHVVTDTEFPLPDENGTISEDWFKHQLETTCNYAPKSRFFSWLIGSLNFQVEHHLFPKVCHVHYKNLSHIVRKTAEEYNLPYHTKSNFIIAVYDHILMLYNLGKAKRTALS